MGGWPTRAGRSICPSGGIQRSAPGCPPVVRAVGKPAATTACAIGHPVFHCWTCRFRPAEHTRFESILRPSDTPYWAIRFTAKSCIERLNGGMAGSTAVSCMPHTWLLLIPKAGSRWSSHPRFPANSFNCGPGCLAGSESFFPAGLASERFPHILRPSVSAGERVIASGYAGFGLGAGRGKSELHRAVCPVIRGPERDGKCHRKYTAREGARFHRRHLLPPDGSVGALQGADGATLQVADSPVSSGALPGKGEMVR